MIYIYILYSAWSTEFSGSHGFGAVAEPSSAKAEASAKEAAASGISTAAKSRGFRWWCDPYHPLDATWPFIWMPLDFCFLEWLFGTSEVKATISTSTTLQWVGVSWLFVSFWDVLATALQAAPCFQVVGHRPIAALRCSLRAGFCEEEA